MKSIPFTGKVACICLFPLLLATARFSTAQEQQAAPDPLKQLSLAQLGEIEVTTRSKAPEQLRKTAAAIFVITQDDIRRSGATSIPEALRLAPGVEVAQIDANKWAIGIRGFGSRLSRSVLVLIDGRSVYTTLLAGTYWEVQDTIMEDIDRIEVIRGPGGTVWGPNAVDGVINIITKKSSETQGLLATALGGNLEQGSVGVRYGAENSRGLSYRVYAKGFNRAAEYHSDQDNFDRWAAVQGGFRMDLLRDARNSFTVQGDIYDERAGERVQLVNYAAPFTQTVEGNERLSGGNILGRWTRTTAEGDDIQLQVYYDRTNRYELNFGDLRNTFDVDFLQRFHWGTRQHLSWGLGARASQGHQIQRTSGLFFDPNHRTDQLYTAFLQDSITLVPSRLALELGTKLVLTNYTNVEPEPSGRLFWTPSDRQTFWLAVTRAVRTPSDGERDFFLTGFVGTAPNGLPFFARFNANRNFHSEILNSYEIGYRRMVHKTIYVDISTFYNQYYNVFSEDITGPPFVETDPAPTHLLLPAQFGNSLFGSTMGGEISPEWRPTTFWRLRGSYSFLHMILDKVPGSLEAGSAPIIVGSSPQHQVLLQSSLDFPKRISFDLDYRYVSALPGISVASYSTANARLAWRPKQNWEFSIVGENLLQPFHGEFASDPGPSVAIKRSAYAKLVWRSREN
jgi:iron complex outermembrane receptor protein